MKDFNLRLMNILSFQLKRDTNLPRVVYQSNYVHSTHSFSAYRRLLDTFLLSVANQS